LEQRLRSTLIQNTTKLLYLDQKMRCQRMPERAKARPTMTWSKAAARRACLSACAAAFADGIAAMATVALAKAALALHKATDEACRVPERLSTRAPARPVAKLAIWHKTAGQTHLLPLRPPPPPQNRSRQGKRRPSDAHLSGTGPCLAKRRGFQWYTNGRRLVAKVTTPTRRSLTWAPHTTSLPRL
jgi:hypothetical protein